MPGSVLNLPKVNRTTGVPVAGQSITASGASLAAAGRARAKKMETIARQRERQNVVGMTEQF